MLHNVMINLVVIKEDTPGKYSILLHDSDGTGWRLPSGDILEVEDEDELPEPNSVYSVSCFHHLQNLCNLSPEVIEDFDILPYSHIRSYSPELEVPELILVYWAIIETEKIELVNEQLKLKNGNARFFPYMDDGGNCTLPELNIIEDEQSIIGVMNNFYKKVN